MSVADPPPVLTEHALLVPFGRFAQQIGLLQALHGVPIKMKTIVYSPGDKLAERLAHILAGGMHVKELETRPHPLVHDPAVAQGFGQEAFASASGVSELLRAVSPESVAVLEQELQQVTAPYRQRLLRSLDRSSLVRGGLRPAGPGGHRSSRDLPWSRLWLHERRGRRGQGVAGCPRPAAHTASSPGAGRLPPSRAHRVPALCGGAGRPGRSHRGAAPPPGRADRATAGPSRAALGSPRGAAGPGNHGTAAGAAPAAAGGAAGGGDPPTSTAGGDESRACQQSASPSHHRAPRCELWGCRHPCLALRARTLARGYPASRHPPTRHEAGIALYQELVLAAQNLLRWFQRQVLARSSLATTGVKDLVRRAANSRALVQVQGRALLLHFAADSSWPGHTLVLPADLAYQLCLPLLELSPPPAPGP